MLLQSLHKFLKFECFKHCLCSIEEVTICFPLCLYALAAAIIARLSDSEPLAVNTISSGVAFINFATDF